MDAIVLLQCSYTKPKTRNSLKHMNTTFVARSLEQTFRIYFLGLNILVAELACNLIFGLVDS